MRIALATCAAYPQLDDDDALLLPAFADLAVDAVPAVWDDPAVRWDAFDAVVLRETWDYAERHDEFIAWLDGLGGIVLNPVPLVRWNADKGYLSLLASGGVPTVPTSYVEPGGYLRLPTRGEFVVKPTISAGSRDTARYDARRDGMVAVGHAQRLLDSGRTVMVQPYVPSVDERGETALLFIGGRFSHAIAKGPLLQLGAGPTDQLFAEEVIEPRSPSAAEREVADAALSSVPRSFGDPVYARVDLVEGSEGPLVLEVELIEPSLFLRHAGPAGPTALAQAVLDRVIAR